MSDAAAPEVSATAEAPPPPERSEASARAETNAPPTSTPLAHDHDPLGHDLDRSITRHVARKRRAQARRGRSLWAQATRVGTVGWLVAVPIVAGALVGHLIDRRLGTGVTWALALLFVGVFAGGYALWRLGFEMREDDPPEEETP